MENTPIISQETMAALLGRSLSAIEVTNYSLYLDIAVLRLNDLLCIKIEDLENIPVDLQLLIARCFATVTLEQQSTANHGVNRKQVEDFSISYFEEASSPMVDFVKQNGATLDKYSKCQAPIRSGKVTHGNCVRCI